MKSDNFQITDIQRNVLLTHFTYIFEAYVIINFCLQWQAKWIKATEGEIGGEDNGSV